MVVRKRSTGALSLLLAGAGTLQVAASAQRWWPACRPGDFETAACLRLQSHTYDFVVPSAPWVPVGHASVLAGLSLLLLGLAVTGLPLLLRPGRRPVLAWLLCAVLGLSQLLAGVSTVASGLLGRAVGELGTPFVAFVLLGWPVALTLTSILMVGRVRRPAAGWLLLIVLLTASTPAGGALHGADRHRLRVLRHHALVRGVGRRVPAAGLAGGLAGGVPPSPPAGARDREGPRHDARRRCGAGRAPLTGLGPAARSGRGQPSRSRKSRERWRTSAAASASYDGSEPSVNRCWSPG